MSSEKIRIALLADLHIGAVNHDGNFYSDWETITQDIAPKADIFLLAGDITGGGYLDEALRATYELKPLVEKRNIIIDGKKKAPVIAVTGNHDYLSGNSDEYTRNTLRRTGITVLDNEGSILRVNGREIGVVGMNGYVGSAGRKQIVDGNGNEVRQTLSEASKEKYFEQFSKNLQAMEDKKISTIVLLHYSPIVETTRVNPTVQKPIEFSYLSPDFAEAIAASSVVFAVAHGHYHGTEKKPKGSLEGSIAANDGRIIPVYNVASPLRKRHNLSPQLIIEI